jgi:CRISPR system Cascade subunit CasC
MKGKAAEAQAEAEKVKVVEQADKEETRVKAKRRHANIEAAVHVAHSFTTHRSSPKDDYFSATDDLSRREESGASRIDTQFFGSGVFYTYVTVNRDLLVQNLHNNVELADSCIEALVRTLPSSSSSNSGASSSSLSLGWDQATLVRFHKDLDWHIR